MYQSHQNIQQRAQSSESQSQELGLLKAKRERFQAANETMKMKNRINQLMTQQSLANQQIEKKNEKTITILKDKFKNEQEKLNRRNHSSSNFFTNESQYKIVQEKRQSQKENIMNKREKLLENKKQRTAEIKNQLQNLKMQSQDMQFCRQEENRLKTELVKQKLLESKLNIDSYWENRNQLFQDQRTLQFHQHDYHMTLHNHQLKDLEIQEQQAISLIKNTKNNLIEDQFNSVRNLSTKQFSVKFPEFYQLIKHQVKPQKERKQSQQLKTAPNQSANSINTSCKDKLKLLNKTKNHHLSSIYMSSNQDPPRLYK